MIAVAPAPVLDCASLSSAAVIAITPVFCKPADHYCQSLYKQELINLHHIFVKKVSIAIYYFCCFTNTNWDGKTKNDLLRAGQDKHVVGSKYSFARWKKADGEIPRHYFNADNEE